MNATWLRAGYTSRGRHRGELFGVGPTNELLTTGGIEMHGLDDGKTVECGGQNDMSQLVASAS